MLHLHYQVQTLARSYLVGRQRVTVTRYSRTFDVESLVRSRANCTPRTLHTPYATPCHTRTAHIQNTFRPFTTLITESCFHSCYGSMTQIWAGFCSSFASLRFSASESRLRKTHPWLDARQMHTVRHSRRSPQF